MLLVRLSISPNLMLSLDIGLIMGIDEGTWLRKKKEEKE